MTPRCPKCKSTNIALAERRPGTFDNYRWSWMACLDCFHRWLSRAKYVDGIQWTAKKDDLEAAMRRKTTIKAIVDMAFLIVEGLENKEEK